MAHLTSAPALHCAREIMKVYDMEARPPESLVSGRLDGLTASERHVATLVDHSTNVHEVVKLRPEMHHWQRRLATGTATAPQLAAFLSKVSATLDAVPRAGDDEQKVVSTFRTYPEAKMKPVVRALSKFSLEAARVLFYYYRMTPRGRAAHEMLDRHHVAGLVEICLGLPRVMRAEGDIRRVGDGLKAGRVTEEDVRLFMRALGVAFDRLPGYENREEEVKILA